ncbi:hypothetical protein IEQ34_014655 [Dendrobium chrysotoxum]|uniref:Uncharacterized protein n=1 Tax=Dendrobium chrysotoxum TaxID=161865 RepID=A0AAV7GM29_DENCH|nr:hypothetical protein IEQ34_014655 [Dendrobium chrysotoxum]
MSIIMGMIVFFRDRGAMLSLECLSQMGHLISDTQGRISFRSKWLDIRTRDPSKSGISDFFFIQNDWNLLKKLEKLKELPIPLHIGVEDLLKILKLSNIDTLQYEVCYLSRYVNEEYLFKVGLSTQVGRSHAHMLKKSAKVTEAVIQPSKASLKRPRNESDPQAYMKNRVEVEEILVVTSKECMEEGFIRGFMKGVRLVNRKTGAEVEGLTPSQASVDAPSDSDGDEIESELHKAFDLNEDDADIEIL